VQETGSCGLENRTRASYLAGHRFEFRPGFDRQDKFSWFPLSLFLEIVVSKNAVATTNSFTHVRLVNHELFSYLTL